VEVHDAIADLGDFFAAVSAPYGGAAGLLCYVVADEGFGLMSRIGIEAVGQFIEEKKGWLVQEASDEAEFFSGSRRVIAKQTAGCVGKIEVVQKHLSYWAGAGGGQAVKAGEEVQILQAGEAPEETAFVAGNKANQGSQARLVGGERMIEQVDLSAVGLEKAGENAKQAGFAGAIGAQNPQDGWALDREGQAVENVDNGGRGKGAAENGLATDKGLG